MSSLPRMFDLPPAWDGVPVRWSGWLRVGPTSMRFHGQPLEERACAWCGVLDGEDDCATGWVQGEPWARLRVTRCVGCGHDTVTDLESWERWDLEPDDYLADGSRVSGQLW